MNLVDYKINASLYASLYSKLEITGTQFLAFRDLSKLISNYVEGIDTLDYGSGAGKSTLYLKTLGLNVNGVDINKDMIKIAKTNDSEGKYRLIESAKIPDENNKYDLVFSSWVMMEVSSKQELLNIAKEITRVLKNDGIFIMIVCNENTYNNDWLSENTQFVENKNLYSGATVRILFKDINLSIYDYFWSDEDYQEIMSNSGLQILEKYCPLGKDTDGYNWINEKIISPITIYVMKK